MDKLVYEMPRRYEGAQFQNIDPRLRKFAQEIKGGGDSIYIHGGVGVGKTYSLHCMARYLREERGVMAKVYNFADALRDMKEDFERDWSSKTKTEETMRKYSGVLMIDDIGAEKPTEWVVEKLYGVVNYRYERKLVFVISSNIGITQMSELYGERIASRIIEMIGGSKGIIKITGADRRTT